MKKYTLALAIVLLFSVLVGCTKSETKVDGAVTARSVDEDAKAIDPTSKFTTEDKQIYVAAKATYVTEGTQIKIVWIHEQESLGVAELVLNESSNFYAHMKNEKFPTGAYTVKIFVGDREEPDQVVNFTVE